MSCYNILIPMSYYSIQTLFPFDSEVQAQAIQISFHGFFPPNSSTEVGTLMRQDCGEYQTPSSMSSSPALFHYITSFLIFENPLYFEALRREKRQERKPLMTTVDPPFKVLILAMCGNGLLHFCPFSWAGGLANSSMLIA